MKNYFEHEIKVKYIDGLLCKSTDWSWFIEYIQENFEPDILVYTANDFIPKFSRIKDIFDHLSRIHELVDSLEIRIEWLKDIDMISMFYLNKISFEDLTLRNDFTRLFALYVLCAKLINEGSDTKYLLYAEIFTTYNIFEIIDTTCLEDEQDAINCIINQLQIDFSSEKDIFEDNMNHIFHRCQEPSSQLVFLCNSAASFSFSNSFDKQQTMAWEERYLIDLLCLDFEDGKLTPFITYRDGSTNPDFNIYTPQLIKKIKNYYQDTEVEFLIESIEYALFKSIPSEKTIIKHINLWKENIENYDDTKDFSYLMCSSLEFLIAFSKDTNIYFENKKPDIFKALSKFGNIQYLSYLDRNNFHLPQSSRNILKEYKKSKALAVDKICDISGFLSYATDSEIISIIDKEIFYKLSDKFEYVIENVTEDSTTGIASAFLDYLILLIKIKNNKTIIAHEISTEIIYIRSLWQDIYFEKCCKALQVINNSIKIPSKEIKRFNSDIIDRPLSFACSCLMLQKKMLVENLKSLSEYPLLVMVTNIALAKDFPYQKKIYIDKYHHTDMIVSQFIEKIYKDNQHKFMNALDVEEKMTGIYKRISENFNMYFHLFTDTKRLYKIIVKNNPQYSFLKYNATPSLGHLTQLFPVLENKIREVGEYFGISSICEKTDKYYKLKEPSSILFKIIESIYKETEEISYASDFLFIHFAMFAENGLNIRNECVHGHDYATCDSNIIFAFKIALFCLHLLDYRIELMFTRK